MAATPREVMLQTLNFENPARPPRDIWALGYALERHPAEFNRLLRDYPMDVAIIFGHERERPKTSGHPFKKGRHVDEWNSTFENLQDGIQGEVRDPLVKDWAADAGKIHIPREFLSIDVDAINRDCAATDKFTYPAHMARPFEQLQFIRGTANLFMDLMDPEPAMLDFMKEMHRFHCDMLNGWARTDVDALRFIDDWGSQQSLLISPELWREHFKPMYRDLVQIAHAAGKKCFMHSDGNILAIYPDLVEIGLDAINSQIFCIGLEKLEPFAGKITFWGEIDRQQLLVNGTPADIDHAVREVHRRLWRKGGCIAQCEFGMGANPQNALQVYRSWDEIFSGRRG